MLVEFKSSEENHAVRRWNSKLKTNVILQVIWCVAIEGDLEK